MQGLTFQAEEGYVMNRKRAFVAERMKAIRTTGLTETSEMLKLVKGVEGVVDLGYGDPVYATPAHIIEAAKRAMDEGHTHYVLPVEGYADLREAIARKLSAENGINADPDTEIIVTVGVEEAINVIMLTLINPGDEVIVPEPYYGPVPKAIRMAGGVPVFSQLREERGFRMDPEDVKRKITTKTKIIYYISPNAPTGGVLRQEDMKGLAQIAQENELLVVTDEIYEKLIYDGEQHHSIASFPNMKDRTISLFGFSKAYAMCGWRIGYLTANQELVRNMIATHVQLVLMANSVAQKAALAALTGPQECVEEMRKDYEARRDFLVEGLNPLGIRFEPPKGSMYIYASISEHGMSGVEFAKRLATEARVLTYPGTTYASEEGYDQYVRFTFTSVTMDELKTGLERIREFVRKL